MDPGYHQGYFPFIEYDYFRARGQCVCTGCHQMILFPLGTTVIQCSNCETVTSIPLQRYFICSGCGLYLTYSNGPAAQVMCIVCNTVHVASENDTEQYAREQAGETCSEDSSEKSGQAVASQRGGQDQAQKEPVLDDAHGAGESHDVSETSGQEGAPEDVGQESASENVGRDDAPWKVVRDDALEEVGGGDAADDVVRDDAPEEVGQDEAPEEVVRDDASEEVGNSEAVKEFDRKPAPVDRGRRRDTLSTGLHQIASGVEIEKSTSTAGSKPSTSDREGIHDDQAGTEDEKERDLSNLPEVLAASRLDEDAAGNPQEKADESKREQCVEVDKAAGIVERKDEIGNS